MLTTNLLVAQYLVAVSIFMLATLAALVVGKAVLVANKMPWLTRYDRAPLIQPILFKTGFYCGKIYSDPFSVVGPEMDPLPPFLSFRAERSGTRPI